MYSVVIPVYEAKESLSRCVESWLGQTKKDLELLLVDDGSTEAVPCVTPTQTKTGESG